MLRKEQIMREQLEAMKVDDIRKLFKEAGISYYANGKRMVKAEMITCYVMNMCDVEEGDEDEIEISKEEELFNEDNEEKVDMPDDRKMRYIESAEIGTLVAFRLPGGKVISAAITRRSTSKRLFLVETKYGAEFKISFDDVLWVRTNKRWPKGIYQLFKRNVKPEVVNNGKENS